MATTSPAKSSRIVENAERNLPVAYTHPRDEVSLFGTGSAPCCEIQSTDASTSSNCEFFLASAPLPERVFAGKRTERGGSGRQIMVRLVGYFEPGLAPRVRDVSER
jgi:hypothetical protein